MTTSMESCEAESYGELPDPFQVQSYDNLLQFPRIPVGAIDAPSGERAITEPVVDAIVVPTIRRVEHLRPAVQLAADARCHLILVYTDSPPEGLTDVLGSLPPGQVTLLTVRSGIRDRLLDLGASLPQNRVSSAALDISRKRNLGLLIGRVCGWTRMLFLDDDIRKLSVAKLSSAAALLDDYPVVGLQVKKYPDASVVGHARRMTGRGQQPFISGGALLANPQILNGYFAPVYHEDWLCVLSHLRKREVAIGGSVGQLAYLPFTTPERAMLEEFGIFYYPACSGWFIRVLERVLETTPSLRQKAATGKRRRSWASGSRSWNSALRCWRKLPRDSRGRPSMVHHR